jgi:hypothetical protein
MYLSMIRMLFGVSKRMTDRGLVMEPYDLFAFYTEDLGQAVMKLQKLEPKELLRLTLARRLQYNPSSAIKPV